MGAALSPDSGAKLVRLLVWIALQRTATSPLFWGARNIDGRGFDTEQNRPTNLQIPLIRK
jgi:hypothetical protein